MKKMKCCGNCKYVTLERDKGNRLRRKCSITKSKCDDKILKPVNINDFCWQYEEN